MIDPTCAAALRRILPTLSFLILAGCGLGVSNADRLDRAAEAVENGEYRAAIIDTKVVLRKEPENIRGRLLLARASVAVGDGAVAEKELRRAVELGASFGDVAVNYARALVQQHKYRELLDQVSLFAAPSDDDRAILQQLFGHAYLGLHQPVEARKYFSLILESDSDNTDAKLGLVASFEAEGNFAQARSTLDEIIIAHPNDVRGWISSGRLNFRVRSLEMAEANFDVALGLANEQSNVGTLVQSLAGLADTLFAQGKNDRGRDIIERLVFVAPNSLPALLLEARLAYFDKDWIQAQRRLQQVLQASPDHQSAKTLLGAVHLESGNLQQAEMYLSSVVASSPADADARRLLVQVRLLQQKLNAAQESLLPLITGPNTDARSLSLAAMVSVGLGDFDDAIDYLEIGLEASPNSSDLQFQLVTIYLNAGRTDDAERVLSKMNVGGAFKNEFRRDALLVLTQMFEGNIEAALAGAKAATVNWPENYAAFSLLGSVEMEMSDLAGARTSFETGAVLSSNSVVSRRYLAALEETEGNFIAARDHYVTILAERPNATWAMFSLARIALRENDPTVAADWLEKVRVADRSAVEPRALLARLYLVQSNYDIAEAVVNEALLLDDSIPALHNILGEILLRREEYRPAASSFRQAMGIDAKNADFRLNLARSQSLLGDDTQAMQTLESTIGDVLSHMPSAAFLASLKAKNGDQAGALEIARRSREVHPESSVPYVLEAEVHVRSGDMLAASKAYDKALEIRVTRTHALRAFVIKKDLGFADAQRPLEALLAEKPLDKEIRIVLAEWYREGAEPRKSINEYEYILTAEPNDGVALNNLAWVYFEVDDSRAEATARKARQLLPENASVLDTLGWILVNSGSVDEGIDVLRLAVSLEGGGAEIDYHLAVVLSKAGQVDEARRMLEEILSTDEMFTSRDEAQHLLAQM